MIYWVSVYMSFVVCIAAVIAAFRFRTIDRVYFPFILCTWIAAVNEIISFELAQSGYSNIANNNVYILLEGILILWQFRRWNLLNQNTFLTLAAIFCTTWFYEIHSWNTLGTLHYYYRLLYAAVVVICSINYNSRLLFSFENSLITNPGFLVCTGYVLYFTPKMLADTYWLYMPHGSTKFLIAVFWTTASANLVLNLLFIMAIVWIPRKPDYITF